MNFTLPNSNPNETREKQKRVKKSGLRAIDAGTRYDISGNLRRLARSIERGDFGNVGHIAVGVSVKYEDSGREVTTYLYGTDSVAEGYLTVEMMKQRMRRV